MLGAEKLTKALDAARKTPEAMPLPEFAYDCHTRRGRAAWKTKPEFFLDEFEALNGGPEGQRATLAPWSLRFMACRWPINLRIFRGSNEPGF